jgi:hypothetical protein
MKFRQGNIRCFLKGLPVSARLVDIYYLADMASFKKIKPQATDNLIKSRERVKKHGEVFTPPELVNKMLDQLPADVWTDPTKTYCDPTCGTGNFLVEVYKRKLAAGHDPVGALGQIYGVDIMPDNIEDCRTRLRDIALSAIDFTKDYPIIELCGHDAMRGLVDLILNSNIRCGDALDPETFKRFCPNCYDALCPVSEQTGDWMRSEYLLQHEE